MKRIWATNTNIILNSFLHLLKWTDNESMYVGNIHLSTVPKTWYELHIEKKKKEKEEKEKEKEKEKEVKRWRY